MAEWSEHFEWFPEEDPANLVNGIYSPLRALRRYQLHMRKLEKAGENAERLARARQFIAEREEKARRGPR